MHDQLADHRVVKHRNFATILHPGVDPHAVPLAGVGRKHGLLRRLEAHQAAGGRQEIAERVFGVDAALDCPTVALDLGLAQRQFLARGDANHQLDQVHAGDALGHRMLHLQTGVHLQEVKTLVFADHKFDRARALVFHRLRQLHRLLAHGLARGLRDERRRRFLNHLLMPALD